MNSSRRHILTPFAQAALLVGPLWLADPAWAQDLEEKDLWQNVEQGSETRSASQTWVRPQAFRRFHLQHARLRALLGRAPKESSQAVASSGAVIVLPLADGTQGRFRFVESPVMQAELAARFPEIKTYLGRGIDDPEATVRFDITPAGFHAQILSPRGAVYVEPHLRGNTNLHAVYARRDYRPEASNFECLTSGSLAPSLPAAAPPAGILGGNLRTYRLACAATAEYTEYFGGTVSAGLAAIVTAINRVTGIFESDLGIRLRLVANNDLIVYTNPSTQPYSNGNPTSLLMQNQANLDAVIGSENYDVGHVFSTAGGGLAGVGIVCVAGLKAQGETGTYPPVGDAFYIDYVAHEIGHQFGASHSFNSSASACGNWNRCAETAYEPGSGSTIMSYAGICSSDNLQAHSGAYFHSASLEQILSYTSAGAGSAAPEVSVTGNGAPTVEAGPNYTIPMATPFTLTATGSDPDGDLLTYCWEERDLGPSIALSTPDNGSSPLFRSFNPTSSPARTFPQWSDILNRTTTPGERLPTASRTMNFRVTARDNSANGGATAYSDTQITVTTNAGPFVVTAPATAVTWSGAQSVTWNVAGTANAPVNAANVTILLSTNAGLSFPIVLASNAPNNGACAVLLPSLTSLAARIKVQAVGNVFFAVSPTDFSIVAPPPAPVLQPLRFANGFAQLTWSASPGRTYRLQYKPTLAATNWTDLLSEITATASTATATDPNTPAAQRFYRVLVLP